MDLVLGLSVAALSGGLLARWHLNTLSRKPTRTATTPIADDPPLEFFEPGDELNA